MLEQTCQFVDIHTLFYGFLDVKDIDLTIFLNIVYATHPVIVIASTN